ncbi:Fis family transcriptional regulator [Methylophaga sp.]|uniref:Fis family transcriptional regulator n=1 Tax=Methylophaga sp. TaxID=2024840 RepID=UPI003A915DF0
MRKTDKKLDNALRLLLTEVCEHALKDIHGFEWLTHLVNYDNYPNSLRIICIFDTNDNLDIYLQSDKHDRLLLLIESELKKRDIKLKRLADHVSYDTEENCTLQHNGHWASRLNEPSRFTSH